ncbi:ATP-binding cassette domain-containing protein, partial [candidate division KSB1 bacterium]|nr:ATP-binding cassette domain-containing protein [candidate division KSB1 bacterium]
YITMPKGATLEATDKIAADVEEKLSDLQEKQDVVSQIYEEDAVITVELKEEYKTIKGRNLAEIKNDINERVENIRSAEISFEQPASSERFRGGGRRNPGADFMNILGIGSQQEKIVIKGRNFQLMKNIAQDFEYYLEELQTMDRVSMDIASDRPEIHLLFDNQILSHYDIPLMSIASELSGFESEFSSGMTFKSGTTEYDIVIRNENLEEKQIDDLRSLPIRSNMGSIYELEQLSRIIYSSGISSINRVNQEKHIEVTFKFLDEINNSKSLLQAARAEVEQLVAQVEIPAGIAVEIVHEETDLSEYKFLFLAAFIFIYMILASVFESFLIPVVMMFAIPLAVIGSLWAIILTGNSLLNANTLTGFLILLGVVVNNGIILIDYTRILRRRGFSVGRALIAAGQTRVRPILITMITTIVALIPLAMGKAEYVIRIGAPFAITVIGGLAVGMLFTLVFIPTTYIGLETALAWLKKLNWKIKLVQLILLIAGIFLIYQTVESLIWQMANGILLIFLIPGATYFIMTSLRRANVKLIAAHEPLTIRLQHVVKIYEDSSRFIREWHKKDRHEARAGKDVHKSSLNNLIWQTPVFIYLIYFIYFYLESGLWLFLLSHLVYLFGFLLLNPLLSAMKTPRMQKWTRRIYFWGVPVFNLILFYLRWNEIVGVIFIAVFWITALAVYTTSNRIHHRNINIARIKGRFSSLRKLFYRFVMMIPVIGRKRKPFRALDGVTLEIGSGMFGLLGPNGAGKTTLMRIICGILEQSRGTIKINEFDLKEKREELQGLIGYLPQEFGSYENLTAYEFLDYQAMLKNIIDPAERKKTVEDAISAVHLDEHRDSKIGSFSGGMKQRIGIAQTLLHLPRILVVDEPTAGLDPRERIRFRNLLVDLSKERIVIFSTHIIEDISSSCDKVAVLNKGKLRFLGAPNQMVEETSGYVWQSHLSPVEFEDVRHKLWLVHHVPVGDSIRVRFLAETPMLSDAIQVRPTLEDAYLWLLGRD